MISTLIPAGIFLALVCGIYLYNRAAVRRLIAEAAETSDVVLVSHSAFGRVTLELKKGAYACRFTNTSTGGKNSKPLWSLQLVGAEVGERTTLKIGEEHLFSSLRDKMGLGDLQIGQPEFDQKFKLGASSPDAARGILLAPRVTEAIRDFFAENPMYGGVSVGRVEVTAVVLRRGLTLIQGRLFAEALIDLMAVLDEHRDAPSQTLRLPPVQTDQLAGVGSESGLPVGFGSTAR